MNCKCSLYYCSINGMFFFAKKCFPLQVCNFAFVSPAFRVLYLGCTAFIWTHILCIAKNIENYCSLNGEKC